MTDGQINIKIAELMGWAFEPDATRHPRPKHYHYASDVPSYTTDLNAMHEVVNALSSSERRLWLSYLDKATIEKNPTKRHTKWFPLRFIESSAKDWAIAVLKVKGVEV